MLKCCNVIVPGRMTGHQISVALTPGDSWLELHLGETMVAGRPGHSWRAPGQSVDLMWLRVHAAAQMQNTWKSSYTWRMVLFLLMYATFLAPNPQRYLVIFVCLTWAGLDGFAFPSSPPNFTHWSSPVRGVCESQALAFVLTKTLIGMGSEWECLFYSLPRRCGLWLY